MSENKKPPQWAYRFLEWYCRPEIFEDLAGDLEECYHHNREQSAIKANLIYIIDVVKFFRRYTIKYPNMKSLFYSFYLLIHNSKTFIRNLARNPLFSLINIVGLAICMSVGLVAIAFMHELFRFDDFHKDKDRIYRVTNIYQAKNDAPLPVATSSALLGKQMLEQTPGLESLVILNRRLSGDVKKGANTVSIRGFYASKAFFEVFSFPVIMGNSKTALAKPNAIVLTATAAETLFDGDPIGQIVEFGKDKQFEVTAVVEDPPLNSHMKFEALVSFQTIEEEAQISKDKRFYSWTNMWDTYLYFKTKPNTTEEQLYPSINQIVQAENKKLENRAIEVELQALSAILPGKNLSNQLGPTFDIKQLYFLIALTLIIIICACFNYTNLSIARSLRRAKEIGVRKVLGANRVQIFGQFITEAVTIALISLLLSTILYALIKPIFLSLDEDLSSMVSLDQSWSLLPWFLLFAICVGIIAGFVPSLLMSKLQALLVLKDAGKIKVLKQFNFRRTLIVLQFTICMVLIISTIGLYRQYKHAVLFDLGFQTEHIVNVSLQGNDIQVLKNEFAKVPGVRDISNSYLIISTGDVLSTIGKYKDPLDSTRIQYNFVNETYIPLHDIDLLAGHNFTENEHLLATPSLIVNTPFLKRFNIGTPEEALEETVTFNGSKMRIIGVLENLHNRTIFNEIRPFALRYDTEQAQYLNLKVDPAQALTFMGDLRRAWKKVDPIHPLQAEYYDDLIRLAYQEYAIMMKIIGFLAGIAIFIAAMGLLGITIYHIETKLKEIGIRKTFGASENQLVFQFSRGFFMLLLVAGLLAIPIAYYILDTFIFSELAYRASYVVIEFSLGLMMVFGLGLIIILWQTRLAARRNPVEVLRWE